MKRARTLAPSSTLLCDFALSTRMSQAWKPLRVAPRASHIHDAGKIPRRFLYDVALCPHPGPVAAQPLDLLLLRPQVTVAGEADPGSPSASRSHLRSTCNACRDRGTLAPRTRPAPISGPPHRA
jgi:hypothetical protein